MANKNEQDLTSLVPNAPQAKRANLMDKDVKAISTSDSHAFGKQVRNEQLALDVAAKQSDQKFADSTRDMARDVQMVRGLEAATKGDYTVNSEYHTASGRTTVTVRKNSNTAAMVIAVIVGIVILFLLNR
ncbi:hypothetical protein [Luteitalea sp. TBR-22]|uniref:hypothetical protein n=1 Tax=Luteitalea sp. TBR-22 TaxID=2802971 RepID=UPI001EF6CDD4|nr:hypothetical protein [Luteitalea sp. TBR-22]